MNRAREWIHCNEAYRRGLTGKGVGVAILDTGVFLHPDLENCVYGFRDFLKKKQQPYDDNGHGTHVAGMIAGSGTASAGRYQGVAPGAQLVCLKVLDQRGNGYVSDVLAGLRWVRQNGSQYGIRIINISVGSFTPKGMSEDSALVRGVDAAWDAGYVVVVAGSRMVDYSGRGPTDACICKPDIVAPGSRIVSCNLRRNGYRFKSGTSMSTPLVAGAAALLLEQNPDMTNRDVKLRFKERAVDLGLPRNQQGWGALDIGRLLE